MTPWCPKCGSDRLITDRYSILFTTADWPWTLLALGAVVLSGLKLGFSGEELAFFCILGTAPICLKPRKKHFCELCKLEFASEAPVKAQRPKTIS